MLKKLSSIFLLLCLLANMFFGGNAYASDMDKNISIRVEGINNTNATDANGEAVITAPSNPGNYLLQISQERDNNYPLLVRTDKSITVTDEPVVLPDAKGYVTISVEKFTLGQGYYKEPVKVPFYDGDNGASILTRLVGEGNYKSTGTVESDFYLSKIKDADTSNVNVPQYIVDQAGGIDSKESNEWLGEFDYTSMSGWMYVVNNEFPNVGYSDYTPQDGDVIRWQFTVYGYGADLGGGWGETYIQPADKDALTSKVAEINSSSNKDVIISNETVKAAYDNAYAVLKNMESTQESVEQALIQLDDALNEAEEPKDTITPVIAVEGLEDQQEVTEKDLNFTIAVTDNHDENITPTVKQNGEIVTGTDGKYKLALTDGENTITIEATDKAGNKADITYKLIYKTITTNSPKEQLDKNLAYILKTVDNPTFGTGGGEWSILSLARANYNVPKTYYDTYYNNVVNKVNELMTKYAGKLNKSKGTEHSRLILGLTAIGKDISNVSGYDIRNALSDYNFVKKQGINGPIFALIALDSKNYEIPIVEGVSVQTTRQMLIDFILDKEIKKGTDNAGGWALSGTAPDPDITAMAIQSLTSYYKTQDNVKAAVDRAIVWLSENQKADGGYASWGTVNAESIAQVVVALTGLGIDPHTDLRFVKNGKSAIDALLTFAVPEGGFMHIKPGSTENGGAAAGVVDGMATDQGTYALVAYDRLVNGKTGLYDMIDVTEETEEQIKEEIIVPNDSNNFEKTITDKDSNKEITIRIPSEKNASVIVKLTSGSCLPKIEAVKGNVSVVIPKGTQITSGDASALELITTKNKNDTTIEAKINELIPTGKKLDEIAHVFTMGGNGKVEFNDFITLTFTGMKGNETAYIQDGSIHAIQKFASDLEGINSGRNEYAYDSENDLIVKTKHFTDFIDYTTSTSTTETPESGEGTDPQPKKYVTLSVDKLTINKGYVIPSENIELNEGDTAWMLLKRELDSRGISYEYEWTEKYDSVYVQAIAGDGEFDHGSGSGWMYNVNGHYPNYGSSKYILKDGDVLQWRYTTNLGTDLGEDLSQWENNTGTEKTDGGTGLVTDVETDTGTAVEDNKDTVATEEEQFNNIDIKKFYADSTDISAWAYEAVKAATQKGFVVGSNGKFSPKSNITRAEFTKIMVSVLELDINIDNVITFTDVDGKDWFYPYINAAYKAGFIVGYDNKFNPNENITREQMAVIIAKALKLNAMKSNTVFKDINLVSAWAKADVDTIYTLGLMVGDNNKFNPKAFATKEMAVVVAMKAFNHINGTKLENGEVKKYIEETGELIQKTISDPVVASVGGEWTDIKK